MTKWNHKVFVILAGVSLTLAIGAGPATQPTTKSADPADAVDFILSAATQPTTAPATQPVPPTSPSSPFNAKADKNARHAEFKFSDGTTMKGVVTTTLDKPLRVWVEAKAEFVDVPFMNIKTTEAVVLWERQEDEFMFLTSGSDIKTFTGRKYPARETAYKFTLKSGKTVEGNIVVPFDLTLDDGSTRLIILHKRDKGPAGEALEKLVYVKKATFAD